MVGYNPKFGPANPLSLLLGDAVIVEELADVEQVEQRPAFDPSDPFHLVQECAVLGVSGPQGAGEGVEALRGLDRESQHLLLQMIDIGFDLNRGHGVILHHEWFQPYRADPRAVIDRFESARDSRLV